MWMKSVWCVRNCWEPAVRRTCTPIFSNVDLPRYTDLVGTGPEKGCFQGHTIFHKAMKEAFEVFVNKDIGKTSTAELLSNFCDNLLKKSGERLSEEALEEKLEKVVRLFGYLSDKDIFAEFYKKQLAKRLLLARSSSDDAERSMIGKLKLRCGAQFTSKLEGMVGRYFRSGLAECHAW